MLETIAGGCRAIASDPRLIMLCRLVESPELAASNVAGRAGLGATAARVRAGPRPWWAGRHG